MKPPTHLLLTALPLVLAVAWLAADGPASADEPASTLERLNRETVRAVATADAAAATITAGNQRYRAVLVGHPARIVAPFLGDLREGTAEFELADGTTGKARLLDGDGELGVSVLALPDDVAARVQGLRLGDPAALGRGSLGVLAGREPMLAVVAHADVVKGRFRSEVRDDAAAFLGPDGSLLGLRNVMGPSVSCSACHVSASPPLLTEFAFADPRQWTVQPYFQALRLEPGLRFEHRGRIVLEDGRFHPSVPDPHPWVTPRNPEAHKHDYVSVAVIARVLQDLERHGRIRHAYLGVMPGQVAPDARGVLLADVLTGSPAAAAKLEVGDVLRALNDVPLRSSADITAALALRRPGEVVRLDLARLALPLEVRLADRDEARARQLTPERLGLACVVLDESLGRFLRIPAGTEGVVVSAVSGIAEAAGLRRGDVVVQVAGKPVRDPAELEAVVAGSGGGALSVRFLREGVEHEGALPSPATQETKAR